MSPGLQAKLLHVLESRSIRMVGSSTERAIDVRIIAATHRDLRQRIQEGTFREDLLYRIDLITLELPPLRSRRTDIPQLVEHFLADSRERHPTSRVRSFSRDALAHLMDYVWPGNVRELAHLVERCVLLGDAAEVAHGELPAPIRDSPPNELPGFFGEVIPMRVLQRRYAHWAFEQLGGQKLRTSERLGVDIKTLNRWLTVDDEAS
jgi:two-component system, NtrC family, response regulator HydG